MGEEEKNQILLMHFSPRNNVFAVYPLVLIFSVWLLLMLRPPFFFFFPGFDFTVVAVLYPL